MPTHVQSLTIAATAVFVAAAGPAGRAQTQDTHQPGIYLAMPGASGETLVRLRGSRPDFKTKGMAKMMLTQGLARGSFEADLAGPVADIRTSAGAPTFYFYLDSNAGQPDASLDPMAAMSAMTGDGLPPQARSAGDFVLIELKATEDKRIADLGKMGSNRPNNVVGVNIERLAQGAYKLTPKEPLKPGEYAFSFLSGSGPGGVLWDFGVDGRTGK